eukprot:gb/GECG01009551.1/.p1 GENE.gb/GECG01009551.1/~~gb/GECG01009551.1/.p1  ORF type:complete len:134 (+),score=0.33 gb/GECG01009551.1/:1-402(+)
MVSFSKARAAGTLQLEYWTTPSLRRLVISGIVLLCVLYGMIDLSIWMGGTGKVTKYCTVHVTCSGGVPRVFHHLAALLRVRFPWMDRRFHSYTLVEQKALQYYTFRERHTIWILSLTWANNLLESLDLRRVGT